MHKITPEARRHRLWRRHLLAEPASGPDAIATAARELGGVHSTDPVSVFLALRARVAGLAAADVERALYEEQAVARILAMRRTMFVVPAERVPVYHQAVSAALAAGERRRTLKMLAEAGLAADPEAWFDRVAEATVAALRRRGEATAVELTEEVPELGLGIEVGRGKKWAGRIGVSTRVLFWLATTGRIVRTRPLGSWRSTLYRWAPTEAWLGLALAAKPSAAVRARARAELVRSYLRACGPVTLADLQWWTGWTRSETRAALTAVAPAEVDLGNGGGWMLAEDIDGDVAAAPEPGDERVVLLPALDSTTMGWQERDWYLGDLAPHLFDRNGNAGPTVWHAGRVVGGWAQRADGEVVVRMLTEVGAAARAAAETEAARLGEWLGEVRFVPRFRTPLERELSA